MVRTAPTRNSARSLHFQNDPTPFMAQCPVEQLLRSSLAEVARLPCLDQSAPPRREPGERHHRGRAAHIRSCTRFGALARFADRLAAAVPATWAGTAPRLLSSIAF